MLPPNAVARLISGLLEKGSAPADLPLPAGSRLYRSELDAFGVFYQYLGIEPSRFMDLVGEAYRQAGKWLAEAGREFGGGGQGSQTPTPSPNTPLPTAYREGEKLSAGVLERLELALVVLNRGWQVPRNMPEVAAALRPLLAFQAEMQRQRKEALFAGVKSVFTAHLVSWLKATR